jgi:RNA polymerase sigma factor (sigma-70 family)
LNELSDQEIINRCVDGDTEIFTQIVSRYKRLVYSTVYYMIKDKESIDDLSQEVFLRVYRNLEKYNSEYKFSTWIVKIATNLCLDTIKKKKVQSVCIDEVYDLQSDIKTPEDVYIAKEQKIKLNKAVDELPEMYKVPIVLYHKNGMSYDEIMKILDEPMSIVKNRLYRARNILKQKLFEANRKEDIL